MTSRILPRDEWSRLKGTEAETIWPHLGDDSRVLVVEDEDEIVGTWLVYQQVHVEGVWIHPDYRGTPGVVLRLLRGMKQIARSFGATTVLTGACSDEVRGLIAKLGGSKLPGDAFVIPIGDPSCPPL